MLPKKILLIVNPVSGKMKSKTGLSDILDELYRLPPIQEGLMGAPAPGRRVTVYPTMKRGDAAAMAAASAAEGYDTVICCGGDGTLNETVNGLLTIPEDTRPVLGYIPAGSTNDFANSIGLPNTLRATARIAVSDNTIMLDIGSFTSRGFTDEPRSFSYIASFGLFTAVSYSTPQATKNVMGHAAYLLESIKDLGNIQSRHVSITTEAGCVIEGDFIFGAVTNTTSAGGVIRLPANAVSLSDGLFEILLIHTPQNLVDLNNIVASLLSSSYDSNPLIEFVHTSSATFHLDAPLSWSLDGEEATAGTRVDIKCLPGAIRLKC